jgi:hypothetical protein
MPRYMLKSECPVHGPSKFDGPLAVILWERLQNGCNGDIFGCDDIQSEGFEAWDSEVDESVREVRRLVCRDCARDIVEEIKASDPGEIPYVEWDSQGFVYGGFTSRERAEKIASAYNDETPEDDSALDSLRDAGFDESKLVPESNPDGTPTGNYVVRVRCSQCEAMTINGTPTHETGCPNVTVTEDTCPNCGYPEDMCGCC